MMTSEFKPSTSMDSDSSFEGKATLKRSTTTTVAPMEFAEIDETKIILEDEIKEKCIRLVPGWSEFRADDIIVAVLRGGLSNSIFTAEVKAGVTVDGRYERKVLVRYFGQHSAVFFNSADERRTFKALSDTGAGPRQIAASELSRIEQFLVGRTCGVEDVTRPVILAQAGAVLANFHNSGLTESFMVALGKTPEDIFKHRPYDRLQKWLKLAQDNLDKIVKESSMEAWETHLKEEAVDVMSQFNHPGWTANPRVLFEQVKLMANKFLETIERHIITNSDVAKVEISVARRMAYRRVFSHNDLHVMNIIESPEGALTLIDVEYSNYGYAAHDFANFFMESHYDFDVLHAPFFQFDIEGGILPSAKKQMAAAYLRESGLCGDQWPSDELVDEFLSHVEVFEPAVCLMWGFWGLIRAPTNKVFNADNFDFITYALSRFAMAKHLMVRRSRLRGSASFTDVDEAMLENLGDMNGT